MTTINETIKLLTEEIAARQRALDALNALQPKHSPTIHVEGLPNDTRNSRAHRNGGMLNVTQAARRLRVSPARIYQLIAAGNLEGHKIDGAWQVDAASVDARAARSTL